MAYLTVAQEDGPVNYSAFIEIVKLVKDGDSAKTLTYGSINLHYRDSCIDRVGDSLQVVIDPDTELIDSEDLEPQPTDDKSKTVTIPSPRAPPFPPARNSLTEYNNDANNVFVEDSVDIVALILP